MTCLVLLLCGFKGFEFIDVLSRLLELCLILTFMAIVSMNTEAGRGAAAQSVTVNRLVVGSIPTRGNEIFT